MIGGYAQECETFVYSPDDDSVNMTVIGGEWSSSYVLEHAFDNNEDNTFHSSAEERTNSEKGFVWDFGRTIELVEISIVTRQNCCRERYKQVCVYVDNAQISCTPETDFTPGDEINMIRDHRMNDAAPAVRHQSSTPKFLIKKI